jgi:hypothetical protein
MEADVKFSPVPLFIGALVVVMAGGASVASEALAESPVPFACNMLVQEAAEDNASAPNLSGTWQMSWTTRNGNQRTGTIQIKQGGSTLSGTFQGERGSAPLKGRLQGNQVSFSVELPRRQVSFAGTVEGGKMSGTTGEGVSWTAVLKQ